MISGGADVIVERVRGLQTELFVLLLDATRGDVPLLSFVHRSDVQESSECKGGDAVIRRRKRRWVAKVPEAEHRINGRIRTREVRVIDEQGNQLGILHPREAVKIARERNLDLVEVAPGAQPPVCKIMDYGKWKYERAKKERESRATRKTTELREVKMRPKIDEHDFQVKSRTVQRLLKDGDKVKVTMRFRGREVVHKQLALDVLQRVYDDSSDFSTVENKPTMQGRTMSMVLAPAGG